jgi:hypothetical protein
VKPRKMPLTSTISKAAQSKLDGGQIVKACISRPRKQWSCE